MSFTVPFKPLKEKELTVKEVWTNNFPKKTVRRTHWLISFILFSFCIKESIMYIALHTGQWQVKKKISYCQSGVQNILIPRRYPQCSWTFLPSLFSLRSLKELSNPALKLPSPNPANCYTLACLWLWMYFTGKHIWRVWVCGTDNTAAISLSEDGRGNPWASVIFPSIF